MKQYKEPVNFILQYYGAGHLSERARESFEVVSSCGNWCSDLAPYWVSHLYYNEYTQTIRYMRDGGGWVACSITKIFDIAMAYGKDC